MKAIVKIIAVALLTAAMLTAAACSSIFMKTEESADPTVPAGVEQVIPKAGGDLFIAMPAEIESFDPLAATSEDLVNQLTLIYETPFRYDVNGRLQNNLIESWTVDETKTVFTFTLRDDVYFSDGTKLGADDVAASARRVLALTEDATGNGEGTEPEEGPDGEEDGSPEPEEEASASPSPTATPDENGELPDGPGRTRYEQYNEFVTNIEAPDERTVRLTMNKAGNAGLHFMTFPVVSQNFTADGQPLGTGPYRMDTYTPGVEMTLLKNDHWWQEAPYLEKIVAKAVTGAKDKLDMQQTSLIDFITTDVLYSGNYRSEGKTRVVDYMTNYYDCLVPNLMNDDLKDVNVRQALSYAIDRREILSTVLLNHGVPTNLPLAPDFFAYDSKYKINDYDSNTAEEFLQASGYRTEEEGEGKILELSLIVSDARDGAYKKEAAKAIKKQLAEVGVVVTVEELSQADYMQRLSGGNYDLAYCSYYMDIVPEFSFLFDTGGPGNYGHVQSREISDAIAACSLAITEEELVTAYGELQKVLTERVPQIGLYYRMNSLLCDESIRGIENPRQNAVFSNIAQWYNSYFAETVIAEPAASPTPTPSAGTAPSGQTEAEETGVQDGGGTLPGQTAGLSANESEAPEETGDASAPSAAAEGETVTVEGTLEG